jgi:hydrogenase expression/formation protein HypD
MEVCGGQTHAIVKYGIDALLPSEVTLVHGPGCPVCVTPAELIDKAAEIARAPGAVLCSFGDMLRVPGASHDLMAARAAGGDVRVVYSPLEAVNLAAASPERQVVFFAVGFETTVPAYAVAVLQARRLGLRNFSLLCALVQVPPALDAILSAPGNRVQGFIAPGHVTAVIGCPPYEPLVRRHGVPVVVAGFEPLDILEGVHRLVTLLEAGRPAVEVAYKRSVPWEGNPQARARMAEVFETVDRRWRGIGTLPASGLGLRAAFRDLDAEERFGRAVPIETEESVCIAGEVLRGLKMPADCPAFIAACTPEHPLGAPMVSSEGACAAYYHYRR